MAILLPVRLNRCLDADHSLLANGPGFSPSLIDAKLIPLFALQSFEDFDLAIGFGDCLAAAVDFSLQCRSLDLGGL